MSHLALIITGLVVGATLHVLNAMAGAMLPPPPGQERTRYGYWYRLAQKLASNSDKLEAALPVIARELAAEEQPNTHVVHVPGAIYDRAIYDPPVGITGTYQTQPGEPVHYEVNE